MFKKLLLCVLVTLALQGGCPKPRKLKSPCIKGNEESTSCKLYSVNNHWLGKYKLVAK